VGAGAAGMNAALEASQAGLKVLVLEKGATIGVSNAAQAGGPSACETVVQAEEDQTVTVETLFRYMYDYSHSLANAYLLRNVLSVSGETINSMVEAGVGMYLRPDNYGAGFRARHGFEERGDDRFQPVKEKVESLGGQFLLETAGKSVIMENGAAAGVLAERSDGTPVEVRAKAVLICTGGYLGNEAMMAEHFGEVKINPLGNTLSDGAGINMVVEAGGVLDRNWSIIANEFAGANQKGGGWSFSANQNFKYAVYGGLMVNREGERFFNEEVIATMALSEGGEATLREGLYYSVIDQAYFDACREEGIYSYLGSPENWYVGKMTLAAALLDQNEAQLQEAIDQGWAYRADTIEEAAAYFGLENLPQTVAEYNAMCEAGEDTRFYKDPTFLTSVSEGPFYVFEYEPSAWGTLGGVKVDSRLRALTAGNEAIPGLYVAGVDAGSMYTAPYYSNEGAALGLAMASGTWAAKEMVQYLAG
jgi:fumarate reductase/succinate dehydrogenase flavoprotein domain protein